MYKINPESKIGYQAYVLCYIFIFEIRLALFQYFEICCTHDNNEN